MRQLIEPWDPALLRTGLNHKSEMLHGINCVCQQLCVCMWSCQINKKQVNITRQLGSGQASHWEMEVDSQKLQPLPRDLLESSFLLGSFLRILQGLEWNHPVGAGSNTLEGKGGTMKADIIILKFWHHFLSSQCSYQMQRSW